MNPRRYRRSSYRALVISLVLACGWPTLTLADCGWILWMKTTRLELDHESKGVIEPGVWEPHQGYSLLAECRTTMMSERASYKDFTVPVEGGGSLKMTYYVACFPNGFDPRPRSKLN